MTLLPRSKTRRKDREVMMRGQKTRFYKTYDLPTIMFKALGMTKSAPRGIPFPEDINYPEVFYFDRPGIVPSPWRRLTLVDQIKGLYYRTQNFKERIRR